MSDQKKCPIDETKTSPKKKLDRRGFLKATGATMAGLAIPFSLSCDQIPIDPNNPVTPVTPVTPRPDLNGKSAVGIVRKGDVEEMVRTAIDLAGGIDEIKQGDTVVIKPNITGGQTGYPAPIATTNPVMQAVIRAVKEKTAASNITVAESSAFGNNSQNIARENGLMAVIQAEGVNFLGWEANRYQRVTRSEFRYLNFAFRIPETLLNGTFKHYINVPILKNHEMVPGANADYTCCMKNHVGTMHFQDRTRIHGRNLGENVAELSSIVPVHTMNVVDALTITLTGGPASRNSRSAKPGLILASKDRVACDSLAVAVLKLYAKQEGVLRKPYVNKSVWNQAQIRRGIELGLGKGKEDIVILNEGVDNFDAIMGEWA